MPDNNQTVHIPQHSIHTVKTGIHIHILVVDDNPNNLFSMRHLIGEHLNAEVFEADSGESALRILLKEKIDLILLDIQMPDMDGFETAEAIRLRKRTRHIPIVFLTAAYKSDEFRARGFAVGAADYLTKPIEPSLLINRIQSYMRFIEKEQQSKVELEHKIQERTAELIEARNALEQRVAERTAELELAKTKAEQAQAASEQANLAKSQFLANMSHELRTPLNAIIGYSEMLIEDAQAAGAEATCGDLHKIHSAGEHLLGLINNVLDLSKIESGRMDVYLEECVVQEVINEVVHTVKPLVEKKHNQFQIYCSEASGTLYTDVTKLRQMLLNLISNAAKFTENGKIVLSVKRHTTAERAWLSFEIQDNGIGMTEAQQAKIFQPFTQADASTTRRYGGTGLGLVITKQFVEMLEGEIAVESQFGQGSTFIFKLPAQPTALTSPQSEPYSDTEAAAPYAVAPLVGEGGVVLLIDSDVQASAVLKSRLTELGYEVAVAHDPELGLVLAHKLKPDTILLNTNTPDSWVTLAQFKNSAQLSYIPVIMLGMESDETQSYALGAVDFVSKDSPGNRLAAVLEKYRASTPLPPAILVVDDEKIVRESVSLNLEDKGWTVLQASNGEQALQALSVQQPLVILLDLNMPTMDGFEFLQAKAQQPTPIADIPVVILSARHISAEEQLFLNQHTASVFTKTTDRVEDLIDHLHQLMMNASALRAYHEDQLQKIRQAEILAG